MITKYPKNLFKQIANILRFNYVAILGFIALASVAYTIINVLDVPNASLPVMPITILGGGLAIFLGFRNNTAYDRWWEARKIWGSFVNSSRIFGTKVMTFVNMRHAKPDSTEDSLKELQKRLIYRHIAFINVFRLQLRGKDTWSEVQHLINKKEYDVMLKAPNKATFLNHSQGIDLEYAMEKGYIEDFRHLSLMHEISAFYDHQGKSERIKKTVFPFYYTYFTEVFLWLFIILLPFSLVENMNYIGVPLSVAISFVFYILDKSGNITEDPFENRASDTPLTAICNTIEIDLRYQLGETDLPELSKPRLTKYDVEFLN